jgi:hypothetical protein
MFNRGATDDEHVGAFGEALGHTLDDRLVLPAVDTTPAPRGAPCLELTPRAGGGVGILDRHVPARDRAVAGVEDLPVRAVIRIRLAVVAEPFLGEAAIGDGAAAVRTRDVQRDASRFARLNVSTLVVGNLLNGRPDTTRD